jgi:hypothetical protein
MGVGLAGMPAGPLPFGAQGRFVVLASYGGVGNNRLLLLVKDTHAEPGAGTITSMEVESGGTHGLQVFDALNTIVERMNQMTLGLEAAEAANPGHGARDVFNYLWELENVT